MTDPTDPTDPTDLQGDLQGSVREFSELSRGALDELKYLLSVPYHALDPDLVSIRTAVDHIRSEDLPRTGDLVSVLSRSGPQNGMCLGCWWKWDTGIHFLLLLQAPEGSLLKKGCPSEGVIAVPFRNIVDIRVLNSLAELDAEAGQSPVKR